LQYWGRILFSTLVVSGPYLCPYLSDLAGAFHGIIDRLVDLAPPTRANYYHPDVLGSWSIKAVLPTIAPDMDYSQLEGIQEGTAASAAYLEAMVCLAAFFSD